MMKKISTTQAPEAIGPYSQAIMANGFIFCSGQIAIDPMTGNLISGDIVSQTKQVLDNLRAVLIAADSDLSKVVNTQVYLVDLKDFAIMNEIYQEYFNSDMPPARATVGVLALPKGALIEISCVAVK